jgi:hypothetical protein
LSAPFRTGGVLANPAHGTGPALQVAGPKDGDLACMARRLRAPLATCLPRGVLDLRYGGGVDGVTGANHFGARAAPDGEQALLFPGSVVLHWLAGIGQMRVNPTQMVPLFAAVGPGVLLVRGALPPAGGGNAGRRHIAAPGPLRLAAGLDQPATLTALLGLDLRGIPAVCVSPGVDPSIAARTGMADAVFVHGPHAADMAPALVVQGFTPRFSTWSGPQAEMPHGLQAESFLATLPPSRLREDHLVQAWRATAAASALCAAMVLPPLSPAAAIQRWRLGVRSAVADEHVTDLAQRQAMRLLAGDEAEAALAPMRVSAATQSVLRRWMARQPG